MKSQLPPKIEEEFSKLKQAAESLPPRGFGRALPHAIESLFAEGVEWIHGARGRALGYDIRRSLEKDLIALEILAALWFSEQLRGRGLTIHELYGLLDNPPSERYLRGIVNGTLLPFTVEMEPDRDDDQRRVEYRICLNPLENPDLSDEEREVIAGFMEAQGQVDLAAGMAPWIDFFLTEVLSNPRTMEKARRAGLTTLRVPHRLAANGMLGPQGTARLQELNAMLAPLRDFLVRNDGLMLACYARLAMESRDTPPCDQCGHTTVRNGTCYK